MNLSGGFCSILLLFRLLLNVSLVLLFIFVKFVLVFEVKLSEGKFGSGSIVR